MPFLPKANISSPATASSPAPAWQKDMQSAFRSLEALLAYLGLQADSAPPELRPAPGSAAHFPLLVPRSFADRMRRGDWRDPLLRQVLPLAAETEAIPGFGCDAVGDLPAQVVPGLLHKYASRALMMLSPQCAVHCRYCFRREFPYGDLPKGAASWEAAWTYLEGAEDLDEVVFSGGDPLFLDDTRLARILSRALALPRIRTLRFHTRLPIVLPSRVDAGLLALLSDAAAVKTVVVVVHANHAAEIAGDCPPALEALRAAGALVLNQTVLLRGVNDDAETLADLSRALLRHGVLPYYLHQLDRVAGTAHFEVPENEGHALIETLRRKLPGYAVPRYVREVAGESHKRPLSPA